MTKVANNNKLLDQVYQCLLCSYFTCNKRDYERHLKTKRCITRHQEQEKLKKEEESKTSSLFVDRVAAKDEYDDFLKKDELTPVNSIQSLPNVLRDISKDSLDTTRRKRKINKNKNNMKKTLSGDNIVISHIELDNLIKPADDIYDSDNNLEDNYIYQTIYTQPLLLRKYIPIVYDWLRRFGKNSVKFFKEMFQNAGTPIAEHDSI
tara:strand:+ start:30301 stop:30918 length:618 start_codon:yes stop_codon:yes gene_type:complete